MLLGRAGLDVLGHDLEVDALLAEPAQGVEHGDPPGELGQERSFHHHHFEVEPPQAPVRRRDEFPRPAHTALVHARAPEQAGCHHARAPPEFLRGLEHPVDAAADTAAIFTRSEEQEIGE